MKPKNFCVLIVALMLCGSASSAFAQISTLHTIIGVRTGWNADSFAVETAEGVVNPALCPTPDGYISEKSFPGYDTYYRAVLTAFIWSPKVVITVDNVRCWAGRPVIVGINLTK